jgi:hypothetical protein
MSAGPLIERALSALARVEQNSRLLRDIGAPRALLAGERLAATDASVVAALALEPVALASSVDPSHQPVRADAVLVGRADNYLRLRAFYLGPGLTVAIHHGWPPRPLTSNLHRGAAMRSRLHLAGGGDDVVAPRPLERGRELRGAWLVEELLPGRPLAQRDWPRRAPQLCASLVGASIAGGAASRPIRGVLKRATVRAAVGVIDRDSGGGADATNLAARISRLAQSEREVFVGPTHGDPGRRNVLLLADGRLALLDWEAARVRVVAHDLVKAIEELDDPLAALDDFEQRLTRAGLEAGGWREQAALACLLRLAGSQRWLGRARVAGLLGRSSVSALAARNRRRTSRLLERLLLEDA